MVTNQVQKMLIVLNEPGDWNKWLKVIWTKANTAEVWLYVNSKANEDKIFSVLTKPCLLTLADFKSKRPPLTIIVIFPSTTVSLSTVTDPAMAEKSNITMIDQLSLTKDKEKDLKTQQYLYK